MIAATILAGNNAGIIAEAVLSVVDHVGLVILIDTGITDGTRHIVEGICAKHETGFQCHALKWCDDFSVARNFSLRAAADAHATWVLTLDTDERMHFDMRAGDLWDALNRLPLVDTWLVPCHDGSYAKERFIRTGTRQRWRGRAHEALVGSVNRSVLGGCTFSELVKPPEGFAVKLHRDLRLLKQQIEDEPSDPRWWFYLGQTYSCLGWHGDAIEPYRKCASLPGWDEQAAWACFKAAESLCCVGDVRQAREACALGLAKHSGIVELPWLAGYCSFRLGDHDKAIWWSEFAVRLNDLGSGAKRIGFRHLPAWFEAPFDVLRYAYESLGRKDEAVEADVRFQRALAGRQGLS